MTIAARSDAESESDAEFDTLANDAVELAKCIFCMHWAPVQPDLMEHMRHGHQFDLGAWRRRLALNFYDTIRLVNYLRHAADGSLGAEEADAIDDVSAWLDGLHLESDEAPFRRDEKYLRPTMVEGDALLYAFDDDAESELDGSDERRYYSAKNDDNDDAVNNETDAVRMLRAQLHNVTAQFADYKATVERRFLSDVRDDAPDCVPAKSAEEDPASSSSLDYYFSSYSHADIHEDMLKDRVRTDSYRDFIYDNKHLFAGKTVLDVGCGTGILSMFAAKAGARKVYAVDNSRMIDTARAIATANNLDGTIEFIRGRVEEVQLPEQVDIIVSEWMGYFLLYEAMLDSVLVARDKWLKPGGCVLPSHASIHLAAIQDEEWQASRVDFWSDVYGFNMQPMQQFCYGRVHVDTVAPGSLLTDAVQLRNFDCNTVQSKQLDFEQEFTLVPTRGGGCVYAFCVWFDILFSVAGQEKHTPVRFSTSPDHEATHWRQAVLPLSNGPLQLPADGAVEIRGRLSCCKNQRNERELDVSLQYQLVDAETGQAIGSSIQESFKLQ